MSIRELDFVPTRIFYDEPGTGDSGTGDPGTGDPGTGEVKLPEGAFMAKDFRSALPEDIRGHAALEKIADIEGLGRSFINAQQMIGKDPSRVVELPTADKPEELKALMTKLGAPSDASGYTLTPVEGAPEWLAPGQDMAKGFLEFAAKDGFLPAQAQNAYSWFTQTMTEAAKVSEAKALETSETNIRSMEAEFGGAFDQKVALANHAIDKLGGEELRKVLNDAGIGHVPVVIKAFINAAGMMTEDSAGDGGAGGKFGDRLSPDEARSKGKALLVQASQSGDMAERRRLNEEAQTFFQMAAPGNVPSTL